jgi:hypothetical protein
MLNDSYGTSNSMSISFKVPIICDIHILLEFNERNGMNGGVTS